VKAIKEAAASLLESILAPYFKKWGFDGALSEIIDNCEAILIQMSAKLDKQAENRSTVSSLLPALLLRAATTFAKKVTGDAFKRKTVAIRSKTVQHVHIEDSQHCHTNSGCISAAHIRKKQNWFGERHTGC
jgi:hypothetical protein